MNRSCCICDAEIAMGFNYFCPEHWQEYKDRLTEPWLRYLMSMEQRERYHNRLTQNFISLEELENDNG